MAQGNYSNGQTPLLHSDIKTILQNSSREYDKASIDWFVPHKQALASYVTDYTGDYYRKTSSLTAFSTAFYAATNGRYYEESLPTDCIDDGLKTLTLAYSTAGDVPQANVNLETDQTAWVTDNTNTTDVYYRVEGRKFFAYLPNAYSSSTPKWSADYKRFPTYPQVDGDAIDVPAEDIDTYIGLFKSAISIPA